MFLKIISWIIFPPPKIILEFQNKSNVIQNACKHLKSDKLVQKIKLPPFPQLKSCHFSSNPKSFLHYTPQDMKNGILLSPERISLNCELSSEHYCKDFNRVFFPSAFSAHWITIQVPKSVIKVTLVTLFCISLWLHVFT